MSDFWGDIYGVDADFDGDTDFTDFMIMDDVLNDSYDNKKSSYDDDDDDYDDDDYEDDIDEDDFDFDINDEDEIDSAEIFDEISFDTAEMLRERLNRINRTIDYTPIVLSSAPQTIESDSCEESNIIEDEYDEAQKEIEELIKKQDNEKINKNWKILCSVLCIISLIFSIGFAVYFQSVLSGIHLTFCSVSLSCMIATLIFHTEPI